MYCIVCNEWEAEETPMDFNLYSNSQGHNFATIHTRCLCHNCHYMWDRWYQATITDYYDTDIKSTIHYND